MPDKEPGPTRGWPAEAFALRITAFTHAVWPYLLLGMTLWVVRYWHSPQFGLYEDDYTRIPAAMGMAPADLVSLIVNSFTRYFYLGRPFHESLIYLFSFPGGKAGGVWPLYGLGFAILLVNAILFYLFLARVAGRGIAIVGGLAFCLYPANTTQTYLTQSFGIQPSLTFFLLASLLYLSRRKGLAYALIAASLLCYETTFAMFFAIPMLSPVSSGREKRREVAIHVAVLALMLGIVALLRYELGEKHVSGLDFAEAVSAPIVQSLVGPLVNIGMMAYRPAEVLMAIAAPSVREAATAVPLLERALGQARMEGALNADITLRTELLATLIVSFPLMWWFLSRLPRKSATGGTGPTAEVANTSCSKALVRLASCGVAMLALSYPLAYIIPAYTLRGRNTRVHFAGVVGASILIACLWALWRNREYRKGRFAASNLVLAALFAFQAAHGFMVQHDYALAWQYQKDFWSAVIRLVPDLSEGTVILVEPTGLRDTWQIGANTWNLPRVLNHIYKFPAEWVDIPRVYRLQPGWQEHIVSEDGGFLLDEATVTAPPSLYRRVDPRQVVFLESASGYLSRRSAPLIIAGAEYLTRGDPGEAMHLERGLLYPLLIGGDGTTSDAEAKGVNSCMQGSRCFVLQTRAEDRGVVW